MKPIIVAVSQGPGKIRISSKTGVPIGVIDSNKLTAKALAQFNEDQNVGAGDAANGPRRPESIVSMLSTLSVRPKDETPEERRARKKALKEYRRVSTSVLAFKESLTSEEESREESRSDA